MMLEPHEYLVGTLDDAQPGSLVLPRSKYEEGFLVGAIRDETVAMFLGGDHSYRTMPCTGTINWRGLIIPDVILAVDHESLVDPDQGDAPLGSLIRVGDRLAIRALEEGGSFRGQHVLMDVSIGLPAGDGNYRGAFLHWQIVLGRGDQRRLLYQVDLRTKA